METTIAGQKLFYSDPLAFEHVLKHGEGYEIHVTNELKRLMQTARGFLDIGSNHGLFVAMAKSWRGADFPVIAVEAQPENAGLILHSAEINGWKNTYILPVAAAARTSILSGNWCWNIALGRKGQVGSVPYLGMALDDIEEGLPPFDVIKCDVEGFELEALMGASLLIEKYQPAIIFEWFPDALKRNCEPKELLDFLLCHGYKLTVLDWKPGLRATFTDAQACIDHIAKETWICDIMAERT